MIQLFDANDDDAAYEKANSMVRGFDDTHCDGSSDRTSYIGVGLYELEMVRLAGRSITEAVMDLYGLDIGTIQWVSGGLQVKLREELSLFKREGDA